MASQGDNTGFMASVGDKYQHCDTVFRRQLSGVKAIRKLRESDFLEANLWLIELLLAYSHSMRKFNQILFRVSGEVESHRQDG